MKDILGEALKDYYHGNYTEDIITETSISEEDVLPLPYLFRKFKEMPTLEQNALQLAKGKVLDVGCGAGSHALWLQAKGLDVTGIDVSKGAVEVSKNRGLKEVYCKSLLDLKAEKYDTILLLMNGTGIFETLKKMPTYLKHLKTLLHPEGQILIDSSDLQYMYDHSEEGGIWVPSNHYYGELEFTMRYKNQQSKSFSWLFIDESRFKEKSLEAGFTFEVVVKGDNYDYLAKLKV